MEKETRKMSEQMVKSIILAFHNALAEQVNILEEFSSWNIYDLDGELFIDNPPELKVPREDTTEDIDEDDEEREEENYAEV